MCGGDANYRAPLPQGRVEEGPILLRNGRAAELRPVHPDDRERVEAFLAGVSEATRRHRFFGDVPPAVGAAALVAPGTPERRLALLVLHGPPGEARVIGHGAYIRDAPDADAAEVALIVDDAFQGQGVGTLLLERLALVAVQHGIRRFHGATEALNRRLRELFRESGFVVEERAAGAQVDLTCVILPSAESVARFELRERLATVASLHPFFRPRSVAVVGASRDPRSIGHRILQNLVAGGFRGPIYPVNPKAAAVAALPAYPSVAALPGPVDLAVIAAPSEAVPQIVDDCGRAGVRALVVVSAGFAEVGPAGRARQEALLAAARGYGMRVVGPNCLGLLNTAPAVRLNASFAPLFPPHGPIGMASQSGALGLAVLGVARSLGLGVSSFVSLGNKADVSGNDLLGYWEDDPDTRVILLYLESFGNPRRFARLARRVGRKKPIVVVKAGRSAVGSRAAGSHTAALAASEVGVEALFHQAGVIRADTLGELFDLAALLAGGTLPAGPRVAVVTNAGGPAILAADALVAGGLELPPLPEPLQAALKTFLPAAASVQNPVDLIAAAGPEAYRRTLELLLADPGFDAVLAIFVPVGLADTDEVLGAVRGAVGAARARGEGKPVLACVMDADVHALTRAGEAVPSYRFPEAAARALAKSYAYARWRSRPLGVLPEFEDLEPERARAVLRAVGARGGGWLSAAETAEVLRAFALPVLPGEVATTPEAATRAAEAFGYPVVVKLASRTLVHKSEWAGVKLGLGDAGAVREACEAIRARLVAAGKETELDGFLVQPTAPAGVELMVGVTHDPLFGPLVAFGLGGVHVEVLRDVVFRLTPLTDRDAQEMVEGIRGYPLLRGYRGAPAADGALKGFADPGAVKVDEVPAVRPQGVAHARPLLLTCDLDADDEMARLKLALVVPDVFTLVPEELRGADEPTRQPVPLAAGVGAAYPLGAGEDLGRLRRDPGRLQGLERPFNCSGPSKTANTWFMG